MEAVIKNNNGNQTYPFHPQSTKEPSFNMCTPLHIAAIRKDMKIIEDLLNKGADFTVQDEEGRTALHCVVYQEKLMRLEKDIINNLLLLHFSLGDPSNPCDVNGLSHFHIACMQNQVEIVEFFLNSGIPINSIVNLDSKRYAGYGPLHFAAEGVALSVIKLLLKYNANMNIKEARGLTAFHILLENKIKIYDFHNSNDDKIPSERLSMMDDVMNLLLDSNQVDDIGFTHFHFACTQVDTSVAEFYLSRDLDVDQQMKMDSPIFPGYTALHFAAHCNIKIAKMLLKKKANYEAKDDKGVSSMDLFWLKCKPEDLQMILTQNWKYMTFLDKKTRPIDIVKVAWDSELLETYLNEIKNIKTTIGDVPARWTGRTILHFAVMRCKSIETMQVCMTGRLNALVDVQDFHKMTPIHLAFRMNKYEFVKILFSYHRGFANIVDHDGLSLLHIACALGIYEEIKQICHDTNINEPYHGTTSFGLVTPGSTALHVAMACERDGIIEMLLHRKLDLEAKDANGQTPLDRLFQLTENLGSICRSLLTSATVTDSKLEKYGVTKLHLATYCQKVDIRKFITSDNINAVIKCQNPTSFLYHYNGFTPLQLAIKKCSKIEVVKILLDRGADLQALTRKNDSSLYEILNDNLNWSSMHLIVAGLNNDEILPKQLEEISGITMLHIACHVVNSDAATWLLIRRVNVNAKVRSDCPVWPNCTPLHVLLKTIEYQGVTAELCQILDALLSVGADVTMEDDNGITPIHLAMRYMSIPRIRDVVTLLFKYLQVFNINPVDRNGMSHFHAACLMNQEEAVQIFLKSGVDVNQPIKSVSKNPTNESSFCLTVERKTEMFFNSECKRGRISWLLNLADGNEDKNEKMAVDEAKGQLDKYVRNEAIHWTCSSSEQIPIEMEDDPIDEGIITDNIDHNVIHRKPNHKIFRHEELMKRFPLTGDEIDCQNETGKTSLHIAAKFGNFPAIRALLNDGADANILDAAKKTALDYAIKYHNSNQQVSVEQQCRKKCTEILVAHFLALMQLKLKIHKKNLENIEQASREISSATFYNEFYKMTDIITLDNKAKTWQIIDQPKLMLSDFLSELGKGLISYCFLSDEKRETIDIFFNNYNEPLKDVCMLQYKKAVKRIRLVKSLMNIASVLAGSIVPTVCIENICQDLTNSDLENFIEASSELPKRFVVFEQL